MAGERGDAAGRLQRLTTTEARAARSVARLRQLGVAGEAAQGHGVDEWFIVAIAVDVIGRR
uniref:Uncharacterized protein n=1 Tax=Oryza barthii TaxID=65489 RepID=A0A0D3G5P4_9ORYZ